MTEQHIGALALKQIDAWNWWRQALANPKEIGKSLPVHDGVPEQGYYRVRYGKDRPYEPVAIWMEDGAWLAYRGGKEARADEIWTFVCKHPVSYEAYQAAVDGQGWPDDDATVAAQVKPPEPTIGDNSGAVDEAETLKDQIDAALKGTEAYAKISDDDTSAKALSLRNRLNELSGNADKVRVKLKAPFLEAEREVDAKFQPLVKSAKAGADKVKQAIADWETVKLQELRKREREAEAARKVEQDRLDAIEAARQQQPDAELMEAPVPSPAPVAHVEAAPTAIKPTYGKAASVSVKVVVDEITDQLALYTYMAAREEVQTLLRQLAQKALDAGRTNIPGITTTEKANVR
jgi:hypothetical protein